VLVDVVVIDLAGGVDIDDTGDEDDDEDDEEDDDELELETSTPNSTTGKASVWPRVALGLLLQAAFIVSRTMTSALVRKSARTYSARSLTVPKHNRPRLSTQTRSTGICVCGKGSAVYIAVIILRSHGRSKPRGFENRLQRVARCITRGHTGGGGCVREKAVLDSIFHID
jgi:hypothetical protein